MNNRLLAAALAASLVANAWLGVAILRPASPARADVATPGEELSIYMAHAQRHAHKLGLSIQAKNKPLAQFYATELDETFDSIGSKFPQYEGYQIAALAKAMLDPSIPPLSKALASADWPAASIAYDKLVAACNSCHTATKHEFVKVASPTGNPFNQVFATK